MRLVFTPLLPLELSASGKNSGCSGAPDSMFFDLGMSPDVRNAAVDACRDALDAQTDGAVQVVGSDFSQANSAVYTYVGAKGAPWRCLVSNEVRGTDLISMGSEGAAEAGPGPQRTASVREFCPLPMPTAARAAHEPGIGSGNKKWAAFRHRGHERKRSRE